MTLSGTSTINNTSGNNTLTGPLTWNHGNNHQFVSSASGTTLTISGPINDGDASGSSTGNLIKISTGTLALNSTASFTGAVIAGLGTVTTVPMCISPQTRPSLWVPASSKAPPQRTA